MKAKKITGIFLTGVLSIGIIFFYLIPKNNPERVLVSIEDFSCGQISKIRLQQNINQDSALVFEILDGNIKCELFEYLKEKIKYKHQGQLQLNSHKESFYGAIFDTKDNLVFSFHAGIFNKKNGYVLVSKEIDVSLIIHFRIISDHQFPKFIRELITTNGVVESTQ